MYGLQTGQVIPIVVRQHAEDAAVLFSIRSSFATAAHVKLKDIGRFDDRVAAHLDGLSIAGKYAWSVLNEGLATPSYGTVFAATAVAIESRAADRLEHLYAVAQAVPEAQPGLTAAFGWAERDQLRGVVGGLLASHDSFLCTLGIAACAMHRVDPGEALHAALEDPDAALRNRTLRAVGELGQRERLPTCLGMLKSENKDTCFWAAWSAVLLGNRGAGLDALRSISELPGSFQLRAMRLALQAMIQPEAQAWLRRLFKDPGNLRLTLQGSGIYGDPSIVPWLIGHMSEPETARLAGEAFSLITGLDLAYLNLDSKPPENAGAGPNDDPEDPNVDMDADDGLPWPDPERITQWWEANNSRFVRGTRYFLGAPVTRENCIRALKEGFQRQRILAAHYLCLLEPGTVLFEWRAPAARQLRLLAAME